MTVVDLGDIIRPKPGVFISADMLDALAGPAVSAPRTYDLTEHERLDQDVRAFLKGRPATPRAAIAARRQGVEVAADHAALKTAYRRCPGGDEGEAQLCRLRVEATDYDNSLADPLVTPVPREEARHRHPMTPAARRLVERRLDAIMATLRARMAQAQRGGPGTAAIRPVRVVIDPTLGLNILSTYGGETVRIGEAVVADVYFRALHRAILSRRADAVGGNSLYDDCADCDDATRESGVYARDVDRLLFATRNLPAFRLRVVSRHWLGRALLTSCAQYPLSERQEQSEHLLAGKDADLREDVDSAAIAKYLPCASDGRARIPPGQTTVYMDEMKDAEEMDDAVMADGYLPLVAEMTRINAQISAELLKSYLFLLAHESYHLWVSDSILQNVEYAADAHAGKLYLQVYRQIDPAAWFKAMKLPSQLGGGGDDVAKMTQDVLGRDPVDLLRETYAGTEYYDGNWSHPPVAQRTARLKALIESGRQVELCRALTDAVAAPGGPAAGDLDLTACRRRR